MSIVPDPMLCTLGVCVCGVVRAARREILTVTVTVITVIKIIYSNKDPCSINSIAMQKPSQTKPITGPSVWAWASRLLAC